MKFKCNYVFTITLTANIIVTSWTLDSRGPFVVKVYVPQHAIQILMSH
jgi:hypothetical protein